MKNMTSFPHAASMSKSILSVISAQTWLKTVALSLLLCLFAANAWGVDYTYSFTIDANDFNTTSYAANNNEKTSTATCTTDASKTKSIKWTSYQVMKSGGNMQWQKSKGYIYNSTDLGTITSVTVTSTAGSYTKYYGTSAHPTSGTTVGNGFFTVQVGGATGTSSQIVVNFTVSESSTPSLTCATTSLSFSATSGSTDSKSFTFSGANLTSDASLALSGTNSGLFSVSPTSVSKGSGTITNQSVTVTYSPTSAGSHSATLTISSTGATSKTITLSGTATAPAAKYTVSFNAGAGSPTPSSLEEPTAGAGITLPSGPTPTCSTDWTFAGWAAANVASSTTTAPTLFAANTSYNPTSNCTLYAVYSNTTGGGGTSWTRVTSIATLTGGGTFIMGYEETAKSGEIIPLRSKDCNATTSANGYFNTGTTDGSSTSGTLDMTETITNSSDYEVYISSPASGVINIQQATSDNYYGATSGGTTSNKGRLYTSGNSNETNLTPEWASESNNQFKLTAGVSGQYKHLKYNTGSPRFAFYNSAGSNIVFYKKGSGGTINYWSSPTCSGVASPTFDNGEGTYCDASVTVKVSNYNSSYNYYYTLDGTTPDNTSTAYNNSTGIVISETKTLKMIAYNGGNESSVTSATYTMARIANTQATAYTVAQARALIDAGNCLTQQVYVKGYVKEIVTAYNGTYGNISFNITDNSDGSGNTFQFYRNFKGANNEKWVSAAEAPQVGNYVIGYGTLTKYSSTYEFADGNYCVVNQTPSLPDYTVNWYVNNNSTPVHSQTAAQGTALTDPGTYTSADCDNLKVFVGWTSHENYSHATDAPDDLFQYSSSLTIPANGANYYAVFANETTTGSGTPTLTKMVAGNTLSNGDKIVIVAHDEINNNIALYQATHGTTYVEKWTFDNNASTVAADDKKWLSVSIGDANGEWYLGDATNGYLYNGSSNDLICSTSNYTSWELSDNGDGTFGLTGNRCLSYRSDGSTNYWRMGGTTCTNGTPTLDIYKYSTGGTVTHSNYTVSCGPSIVISPSSLIASVPNGGTANVTAIANLFTPTSWNWSSSNTDVATVERDATDHNKAVVTYKNSGTCTITCTASDGDITKSGTCAVLVPNAFTVTLIDNGVSTPITVYEGATYTLPDEGESKCEDATFLGWTTDTYTNGTTTLPTILSTDPVVDDNLTLRAVYRATEGVSGWTKMGSTDVIAAGNKIVIVTYNDDFALYHNESTSKYIDYWTFDADAIDNDDKNWLSVSAAADEKWYLGDATIGYLYNGSSTDLTLNSSSKTAWTIAWNSTKSAFTLYNSSQTRYLSCRTDLTSANANFYRMGGASGSLSTGTCYFDLYKSGGSTVYTNKPSCCTPPTEKLKLEASSTELVGSGSVTLTVTGGNGKAITWSASTGGTLSNTSDAGATLSLPTASETKEYTVTITQEDDEISENNVICGGTITVKITVKAQYTITYKVIEEGSEETFSTVTVTEGETYTLPDLSEDYSCPDGISFAGWASANSSTSVEKNAGATATATANATWWALWGNTTSSSETVDIYEEVTAIGDISAGDKIIIGSEEYWLAMSTTQNSNNRGQATIHKYGDDDTKVYFLSTDGVQVFTLGGNSTDKWSFFDGSGYIYAASSSSNYLKTQTTNNANGLWEISIASDGAATITAQGANTHNLLQYNKSSKLFSCYNSTQSNGGIMLYRRTGQTTSVETSSAGSLTTNTTCATGAVIRSTGSNWITSANGQKVKTVYQIVAKGFETAETLSITSNTDETHFKATLAATAVPAKDAQLETTLTVEYTPTAANTLDETTITLTAGEVTRTIIINGRSLPDEFVLVSQKSQWYALPANMNNGANQYEGIIVTPDDNTDPTQIPVTTSTVLYSLKSVASSRYESAGNCVRLVGNGNRCLWSNSSASSTTIQDYALLSNASSSNYEWSLQTTDGIHYTIINPAHPDAAAGRGMTLSGTLFGLYKPSSPTIFYILPVGCSSQPDNVSVSPRRIDATFTWTSNASSMQINVTPKAGGETKTQTFTSSPAFFDAGLNEKTDYIFTLVPDGSEACMFEGEFTTTGPTIDAVNWEENAMIIQVDKDESVNPWVIIAGEKETGVESQIVATDLFFAKYFEGSGSMKLISIFNGTRNDINLSGYMMKEHHAGKNATTYGSSTYDYDFSSLGKIKAGQEIIFFTRPKADDCGAETQLYACSEEFLTAMSKKSGEKDNPRWIECDGTTFPSLIFNGNDALVLYKDDVPIDIFGALSNPTEATVMNCREQDNDIGWSGTVKNMDYGKTAADYAYITLSGEETLEDYGINLEDEELILTTARCILFRAKVSNGDNAVTNNSGSSFATFTPEEWNGRSVCTSKDRCTELGWTYKCGNSTYKDNSAATCSAYEDLGKFDYNNYYKEYDIFSDDTQLNGMSIGNNEYRIDIANMKQYACLNVKLQLTSPEDKEEVLTEVIEQVPIVVTGEKTSTSDIFSKVIPSTSNPYPNDLYNASRDRCADCNVVILKNATLTKVNAGSGEHDVPVVRDIKVYAGGLVSVPTGTSYIVNSLTLRREEEEVALAKIEGEVTVNKNDGVGLNIRIDPTNWHYFTLPYDCNVSDITFVDGTPAAVGTDFLLCSYDGEHRAATKATSWKDLASSDILRKGIGYIIALPGEGLIQRELCFPMSNEILTEEKAADGKDIGVLHAWGGDDEELRPNHKGWNLIGNPYLTYYETDLTSPLLTGELIKDPEEDPWKGHWTIKEGTGSLYYIVIPQDNGWSEYKQVTIANYHMAPFTSYFVQMGGDPADEITVNFKHDLAGRLNVARRSPADYEEDNHEVWFGINLTNSKGEQDETTLLMSDLFTDEYDMMRDLVKMRGTYYNYYSKPVLASRNSAGEMAFNALPDQSAKDGVPLNFYAAAKGDYTIAIDGRYSLDEIKEAQLYDAELDTWHNLLTGNYSFTVTKKGDNKTRFTLYVTVERKQPQITTDKDNINGQLTLTTLDKTLILSGLRDEADIYVYDMSGKLMAADRYRPSDNSGVWRTTVPTQGVYFVRIAKDSEQQTLHTIVY